MNSTEVRTIGDLIQFLSQFDPGKRVMIFDPEWGMDMSLQDIAVEDDRVVFYD